METQSGFGLGGTTREPEVGFGLGEGRRPLLEGVNLLPPEQLDQLKAGAKAALLRTKALGQNLGILIGAGFSSVWNHKLELATGMIASGATKAVVRAALTGSGAGIATLAMVGAAGGAVGGAAKEYAKQSKDITLADESRKLLVGFFINEYHKLPQIDKGKVGKAALKGAAFGAAGAVIGGIIADNEWVQDKIYATGDWVREKAANLPKPDIRLPQFGPVPGPVQETTPPIEPELVETITVPANSNVEDVQKIISGHVKDSLGRELLPFEAKIAEIAEVDLLKIAEAAQNSAGPEIKIDATAINGFIDNTLRPETYDFQFNKPYDLGRKLSDYINMNLLYEPSPLELEKVSELILLDNPDLSDQLDLADSEGREVELKVNFHTLNDAIREARAEGRGLFPDLTGGIEPPVPASEALPSGPVSLMQDAGQLDIASGLAKIPEMVQLPPGSNPWEMSSGYLREVLGREPTNAEILEVAKTLCRESKISVPVWGIAGEVDQTKLPAGYKLVFNDNVRKVIGGLKK